MTNANEISITAVIPAYNCAAWIARSIDSVLNQTRSVDEVIVVDDGSTDGTAEVIKVYGDRVCYVYQDNAGVSAARNAGIKAATGNWIAFLDADDEWLPDKIQRQTDLLARHPDVRWATGNYIECLCDEKRKAPYTVPQQSENYLRGREYYEDYLQAIKLYEWGHTDCMLIQRKVFEDVGLFCTDLSLGEDVDMWLRISYRFPKVAFSSEPLSIYHLTVPESLMTADRARSLYTAFIERHVELAQAAGRRSDLMPAAGAIMRRWIRGMLFEGRKFEIRELLSRFPQAFCPFYRAFIYTLTICPPLTVFVLHALSRIIRMFQLRRRLTRPPAKTRAE